MRRAQAVRDRAYGFDGLGRAGGEAPMHGIRAFRLHAVDAAAGARQLHRRGHAGAQPAAPDGHHHRFQLGHLLDELEAEGGGAERGARAFERMHERASLLRFDLLHAREGPVHVLDELHLGAELAAFRDPERVGGPGHRDLGRRPEHLRRVRDGDGVVAGADRGDTARERVLRQVEHDGEGAPRLEGARPLEQLLLQEDPGSGSHLARQRGIVPLAHGRRHDEGAQAGAGGADGGQVRRPIVAARGSPSRAHSVSADPPPCTPRSSSPCRRAWRGRRDVPGGRGRRTSGRTSGGPGR